MDFGFDDPSEIRAIPDGTRMGASRRRGLASGNCSTSSVPAGSKGRPAQPEEFLDRWPNDPDGDPDVASLLLEDYLQRRRRGQEASLSDYHERFPEQTKTFGRLLAKETVLRSMGGASEGTVCPLRLPDVGDEVFGFRLCRPLGEGAFARVFLAEQADLAGRPVVLKVSDIEGTEPQTLAQLLHTNIVPIYSLHEDRRAGLRAVCMPYLGGASLSAVLARLWTDSRRVGLRRSVGTRSGVGRGAQAVNERSGATCQGPGARDEVAGATSEGPGARGRGRARRTEFSTRALAPHPRR